MNRAAKNIIALLTSIVPMAPSLAEDQHLTIIGSWQIEDLRTFSGSTRVSGTEGKVRYFLAPISNDPKKNGLFYVACVDGIFYLDIEIQKIDLNTKSMQPPQSYIAIYNTIRAIYLDLSESFFEHNLLKIPITEIDLKPIGETSQFDLIIRYGQALRKIEYRMVGSQEAVAYFLQRCKSSR